MDRSRIISERAEIVKRFGPWTAHDIALDFGISTMDRGLWQRWRVDFLDTLIRESSRPRRETPAGGYYQDRRILDLACLEGLFAIEFARKGATTLGIEIRDAHLARARFARDVLGLENCRLEQGDIREIGPHLGEFDVVLCCGILYHLDFPDCVHLLARMAGLARDLVLVDSHFAYEHIEDSVLPLSPMRSYQVGERVYRGRAITEHAPSVTVTEKAAVHVWASIDNDVSVWLDERDVVAEMDRHGFALAARRFPDPEYEEQNPDRPTLVFARKAPTG